MSLSYTCFLSKNYEKSLDFINRVQQLLKYFTLDLSQEEYSFKAEILGKLERYEEAISIWKALRLKHDKEEYFLRIGAAYWYSGSLRKACFYYEKVNDPDVDWYSSHGQILAELDEYQNAEKDLTYAIDHDKSSEGRAYPLSGRGFVRGKQNRFSEAFKDFKESIAICPNNAWVYFNRAQIEEDMGDFDVAIQSYKTSLEKTEPPLPKFKRDYAQTKINELELIKNQKKK